MCEYFQKYTRCVFVTLPISNHSHLKRRGVWGFDYVIHKTVFEIRPHSSVSISLTATQRKRWKKSVFYRCYVVGHWLLQLVMESMCFTSPNECLSFLFWNALHITSACFFFMQCVNPPLVSRSCRFMCCRGLSIPITCDIHHYCLQPPGTHRSFYYNAKKMQQTLKSILTSTSEVILGYKQQIEQMIHEQNRKHSKATRFNKHIRNNARWPSVC